MSRQLLFPLFMYGTIKMYSFAVMYTEQYLQMKIYDNRGDFYGREKHCRCIFMSDTFFFAVGIILAGIGLLLLTAKVMTYIKCTVPINATVVKLEKECTFLRGVERTRYRPVVRYVVDGKSYTEEAYFRTYRKTKYQVGSETEICYNPKNPKEMRFVGHPFPLPLGLVFLLIGAVLIWSFFI